MTTLLASLALFAGAAQAQDLGADAATYDMTCTDTQINMTVRVTPVADSGPITLVYRDGAVQETLCTGALGEGQQNGVFDDLLNQCLSTELTEAVCEPLVTDIVEQMAIMSNMPPVDRMALVLRDQGDDLGTRGRLAVSYDNEAQEAFRVSVQPDGMFSGRARGRLQPAETQLDCREVNSIWVHGIADETIGHIEVADTTMWQCVDDNGLLDIDVRFRFKNRAAGQVLLD